MKIILTLALFFGGIVATLYPFWIVKTFGHMAWAEQKMGSGGSYGAWRMIGVAMILASYGVIRFL